MMITSEQMKEARKAQAEYWGFVLERCGYIKKFKQSSSEMVDTLIENYASYNGEYFLKKFRHCVATGYEALALWWLNQYIDDVLNYKFNQDYNFSLKLSHERGDRDPSKVAMNVATKNKDDFAKMIRKSLK